MEQYMTEDTLKRIMTLEATADRRLALLRDIYDNLGDAYLPYELIDRLAKELSDDNA